MAEEWASGYLLCLFCGHEHIGAWLIGSEPVECPQCEEMACVPEDGLGFGEAQTLAETEES